MYGLEDMTNEKLIRLDKEYYWHHLTQHKKFQNVDPTIMVEGNGCYVKDLNGNEYLDFVSGGVWCVNVGYGRTEIADTVRDQMVRLPYYAASAGNPPTIAMAAKIHEILPGTKRLYLSNSGSEANEKAFKLARQYFRLQGIDKYKILYRYRDYHGTTLGALSATGQAERKSGFEPLVPGFFGIQVPYCYRCPYKKEYPNCDMECARSLETTILAEGEDTVSALIVEPITAGGGIIVPPDEYFKVLQEICRKYHILLIMDEVVCGFGRTGKWFGHQHWDVDPDMVTSAKGMASAYMPISMTAVKEEIFQQFLADPSHKYHYFRDISTFGGSAASAAGTLANIKIIEEEKLLENAAKMGSYLMDELRLLESMFPIIGQVRGKGLLVGIELVEDRKNKVPVSEAVVDQILAKVSAQRVLLGKTNRSIPGYNNTINFAPPFIVTKEQIDNMIKALVNALIDLR